MEVNSESVHVEPALPADCAVIAALLPGYLRELGAPEKYPYLYWTEAGRFLYLIYARGDVAGFALVRTLAPASTFEMAEFYIVPQHRRNRIGRAAAQRIFAICKGEWQIAVLPENRAGLAFWRAFVPAGAHLTARPASTAEEGRS